MTKERCKELLPIITAFAEGKTIQFKNRIVEEWTELTDGWFDSESEYRIKPEPREWWCVWGTMFSTLQRAQDYKRDAGYTGIIIHVREMI